MLFCTGNYKLLRIVNTSIKLVPLGKRGWKMFYASLRDLVLYLHKDEHGFSSGATFDDTSNAVRFHHSLAMDASDYAKRQYVFRVRAADWSEYMFQARSVVVDCGRQNMVFTKIFYRAQ